MFDLIKKIFDDKGDASSDSSDKMQDADTALCVLLLEAAHADGQCSLEEKEHIIETLAENFGLQRDEIDEFLARGDRERKESVDLFQFTRYMNNHFTKQEKIEVMEAVWRIIQIDGQLEKHEDHFAHKLSNLLRLSHKELIDAKIQARLKLAQ